jgi:hypothetical protein
MVCSIKYLGTRIFHPGAITSLIYRFRLIIWEFLASPRFSDRTRSTYIYTHPSPPRPPSTPENQVWTCSSQCFPSTTSASRAVHYAASAGKIDAVEKLLDDARVDIEEAVIPREVVDNVSYFYPCRHLPESRGLTHIVAHNGHPELLQVLLERGADPRSKTLDGHTPRHCCEEEMKRLVRFLCATTMLIARSK